jgi:hypothetical protein
MIYRLVFLPLLFAMSSSLAFALTQTQLFTFTSDDFDSGFMSGGVFSDYSHLETPVSVTLAGFDPVSGTLTGVTVNYAFTFAGGLVYGADETESGFYNATLRFYLNGSETSLGNFFEEGPVGASGAFSAQFSGDLGTTGTGDMPAAAFLVEDPVIRWSVEGTLQYGFGDSGGQIALSSGTIEVVYTYDPAVIPEPSSGAVLAGAVALMFVWVRRRRKIRTR